MVERFTRRRFGATAIATASVAVAGCMGGEDDEIDTGDQAVDLIVTLEDEAGEPVSQGVTVRIEHEDGGFNTNYQHAIDEGRIHAMNLGDPGEYAITVESVEKEDDFAQAEETVDLGAAADADEAEENAEEVTIALDGALSDSERAKTEEGENGEDEENSSEEENSSDGENGEDEEGGDGDDE